MSWDPEYASGLIVAGATQDNLRKCFDLLPDENHYERLSKSECLDIGVPYLRPVKHVLSGMRPVLVSSGDYPSALRDTSSGPALLYVKGSLPSGSKALAVVGTRRCTSLGLNVARASVEAIAASGGSTISGLALGCDTAGHEESLRLGVPTVAVLACGLDSVYPSENSALASRILDAGGALLSEQPPGIKVSPQRLMMRNRIIAGSSFGIIPAECPIDSRGTINAVRTAHSYGRFVFLARAKGAHRASQGAWLTEACLAKSAQAMRMLSKKNGPVFSPNFIAESAEDLKEVLPIALALSDHTI